MIQMTLDTSRFTKAFDEIQREQIPYAESRAINALALEIQTGERQHIHSAFIVRRDAFIDRSVKIPRFSDKNDGEIGVTIEIDPSHDVLSKFEAGGTKSPHAGGASVAVPFDARTSPNQLIAKNMRPRALQLLTKTTKKGKLLTQGLLGTYLITLPSGKRGIFQRTGPGKNDTRLLYWLTPSVPIRATLQFIPTALRVINERWAPLFSEWMSEALRTAR